jgi:hypothetical protein
MTTSIDQSVRDYLDAYNAYKAAQAAKEAAENAMKNIMAGAGVHKRTIVSSDGGSVTVTVAGTSRSTYDVTKLQALVSPNILKKVTKPAIDAEAFEAAVIIGLIDQETASTVKKTTQFSSVRVTARGKTGQATA